nr:reverse transcriptase domain-containing protein [Tanacetum cinerariifolium]
MADQRTMAQLLQAPTEGYEDVIVVPAISADNFELKHGLLTLVQNKRPDLAGERTPSIDFHLGLSCFEIHPPIIPPSKTTNLRNKITNFQQRFDESFSEVWDRFKDLLRTCPHHGFSKLNQLDTFYNALNSKDQDSLNFAAGVSTNTSTFGISPDVVELKDMVKALLLDKKATNGNVYRDNIQEFVSQASAAPAPQTQGVSKEDFLAYVKANDTVMRNMQTQGQNMQNQLTNLTDLITKFVNSNSASTSSSGTLPSNTIANPRSDLKAINTRSGVSYDGPQIPPPSSFLPKVVEDEPEATKDIVNPTNNGSTEDVQPPVVQSESPVLTSEPVTSLISEPVIAPLTIKLRNSTRSSMSFEISFADALILMPKFALTLKALIGNKEKLSEMARTSLNEHCSTVLLKKLPKKLGDPCKFLIPCDFLEMVECLALADLDASINLMLFSVWKRLSLPDLTPMCMNLELADRSISRPVGVSNDVYVKEVLGFSDTISSGSPTTYYDPIVSITSPTLTPFGNNDFLFEEVDTFLSIEDDPTSPEFYQPYLDPEGDILLLEAFLNNDPSLRPSNQVNYLPEVRKELKICEAKSDKSSVDEPPEVELKVLPPLLEYAFLEGDNKLPVIIAKYLSVEEKTALITVLKSHKRAIAWKLFDIKGIDPEFCTHKILMEEDFEPAVQHQRRVNPKIHDVIKREIRRKPHSPAHTERLLISACLLGYAMLHARFRELSLPFRKDAEKV